MSDEREPVFPQLTDGNYAEWEIRMEADLVDKGLWDYVFGEVMKPEGDSASAKKAIVDYETKRRQARARMIKRVTAGQLPHMRDPDPKKVWAELKRVHRAGGFGSKLAMRRRFINANMKPDESMASWIGRVKGMGFELEAVEVTITEEDLILVLTNGLPVSYEPFVIALDAANPADITLSNVVARLANEEGRQGIDIVKKEEEERRIAESALATVGKGKVRRDRSEITCFGCRKKGHFRSECPERKEESSAGIAVYDERFTF